jgi:hypothetical protein
VIPDATPAAGAVGPNLQVEAFVLKSGGEILDSVPGVVAAIERLCHAAGG